MKTKYCVLAYIVLLLYSCTERVFTPVTIAYKVDSITSKTINVSAKGISEWEYSSTNECINPITKYTDYQINADIIDSLKLLLPETGELKKGVIYTLSDQKDKVIFVITIHDDSLTQRLRPLTIKGKYIDKLLLLQRFIKGRKFVPVDQKEKPKDGSNLPPTLNPPPPLLLKNEK